MSESVVSTGLQGLDQAIGSLHAGENVVWQIKNIADYMYVANQFVMTVARTGRRIVYIRFADGHLSMQKSFAKLQAGCSSLLLIHLL